jgi:hypothetical protein
MLNQLIMTMAMAGSIAMSPVVGRPWNNPGGNDPFLTCASRGGEAMASVGRSAEALADRVVRICTPLLEASLAGQRRTSARQRAAVALLREQNLRTMRTLAMRSINRTRRII